MIQNPEISIIMPSYNVAMYICQCMDSVLEQTFSEFEIISIDAGSNDGTYEILQEYEKQDNRIKLVKSEKKSYGYQVNLGLKLAKGEYIGIVETDDVILPEMYEKLYRAITQNDMDYVKVTGDYYVPISTNVAFRERICDYQKLGISDTMINPKCHPELYLNDRYIWLGLYKKSFLKDRGITFNETEGAAYQDIGFQVQVLIKAEKAFYINSSEYLYRLDNENASGYSSKAFGFLAYEYEQLLKKSNDWNSNWKGYIYLQLIKQYLHRFHLMARSGRFWDEAVEPMEMIREQIINALDQGIIQISELPEDLIIRLSVLRVGIHEVYGSYLMDYSRQFTRIRNWLSGINSVGYGEKKQFVVFGYGQNGQYVRCLLKKVFSNSVVVVCDNNSELNSESKSDVPILKPEEAIHKYPKACYILTSYKHQEVMRTQLKKKGISDDNIICYFFGKDVDMLTINWKEIE